MGIDYFRTKIWAREKILSSGWKKTNYHILMLYDLEDRNVIWKYEQEDIRFHSPIIADNKLFVGTSEGKILAFTDPESLISRADRYLKEKDNESALFLFQKAREYYGERGDNEKVREIEEKIRKIEEESEIVKPIKDTKIKHILVLGLGLIALTIFIIYFKIKKSQVKK